MTMDKFDIGGDMGGGGGAKSDAGHEATETGFAYAPVSQAHGHNHNCSMSGLLHCSVDQFCTTPGGF